MPPSILTSSFMGGLTLGVHDLILRIIEMEPREDASEHTRLKLQVWVHDLILRIIEMEQREDASEHTHVKLQVRVLANLPAGWWLPKWV